MARRFHQGSVSLVLFACVAALTPYASAASPSPINVDERAALRFDGPTSFGGFAGRDQAALDFNGDGRDDLAVSRPSGAAADDAGTVYIAFGGTDGRVDAANLAGQGVTIDGRPGAGLFGAEVDEAGDFNGDGFEDLVVGAPGYGVNGSCDRGSAYVLFGSASPEDVNVAELTPAQGIEIRGGPGDRLGFAVAGGGDFNGDTYPDVIAASGVCNAGERGFGYVIFGTPAPQDLDAQGLGPFGFLIEPSDGRFFEGVSFPGDLDRDGFDDLALVQQGENRVFVIRGTTAETNFSIPFLEDDQSFQIFGRTGPTELEPAGDMNGDGADDLAIMETSGATVFLGGDSTGDVTDVPAEGRGFEILTAEGEPGSVAGDADLDADGRDDLVIGLPGADRREIGDAGAAVIVQGTSTVSNVTVKKGSSKVAARYEGSVAGHNLGETSALGDFDGDGLAGLALGAPGTDFNGRLGSGSVYAIDDLPTCATRPFDIVLGTPGNDAYQGSSNREGWATGDGDDSLELGGGRDCGLGGDHQDLIAGGGDADTLFGGEGDDRVNGGPGKDDLRGGLGLDRIDAVDGTRDFVDCGRGYDIVRADPEDVVRACEKRKKGDSQGSEPPDSRPHNDDFRDAAALDSAAVAVEGTNEGATLERGEPRIAGREGGSSVWYLWTAPEDGELEIENCGSALDTLVGIYEREDGRPAEKALGEGDDCYSGGGDGSHLWAGVKRGHSYLIAVDGFGGQEGEFELSLTFEGGPEADNSTPERAHRLSGYEDFDQRVPGRVSSLFYRYAPPADGSLLMRSCGDDITIEEVGGEAVPRSFTYGSDDLPGAACAYERGLWSVRSGREYLVEVKVGGHLRWRDFSTAIRLGDAPPNDSFAAAEVLEGANDEVLFDRRYATEEPNEPGFPYGGSLWYRWTAPADGQARVRICSDVETTVDIYRGAALAELDRVAGGYFRSYSECGLRFAATAGETYAISLSGNPRGSGLLGFEFSESAPSNDDFADAAVIEGADASAGGTLSGATAEAAERSGLASVWYAWEAPGDGPVRVDAGSCDDPLTPRIDVFQGVSLESRTTVPLASDFAACTDDTVPRRPVTFTAEQGERYLVRVAGNATSEFDLTIAPVVSPRNDERSAPEEIAVGADEIAATTLGATTEADEPESWSGSLWYRWTAPATGIALIESCQSDHDTALAAYREGEPENAVAQQERNGSHGWRAYTECSTEFGAAARIAFRVTEGEAYLIAVANQGSTGIAHLRLSVGQAPGNDDLASAELLPAEPDGFSGDNTYATSEEAEAESDGATLWHRWTPTRDMKVSIRTCSSFPITIFEGTSHDDLTQVARKPWCDRTSVRPHFDWIHFAVEAGRTYSIRVDGSRTGTDSPTRGAYEFEMILGIPNDRIADATPIQGSAVKVRTEYGISSLEEGEPYHSEQPGSAISGSVWFKWTAPESGAYRIGSWHSAAYTGNGTIESLRPAEQISESGSRIFQAERGTTYWLAATQSLVAPRYSTPAGPVSLTLEPVRPGRD